MGAWNFLNGLQNMNDPAGWLKLKTELKLATYLLNPKSHDAFGL